MASQLDIYLTQIQASLESQQRAHWNVGSISQLASGSRGYDPASIVAAASVVYDRQRIPYLPKGESMLDKLKNWSPVQVGWSVETLVELAAYGHSLEDEFVGQGVPAPKWLTDALRTLKTTIATTWRTEREQELRTAERELEELRSREEKRADKEAEVARLREELG